MSKFLRYGKITLGVQYDQNKTTLEEVAAQIAIRGWSVQNVDSCEIVSPLPISPQKDLFNPDASVVAQPTNAYEDMARDLAAVEFVSARMPTLEEIAENSSLLRKAVSTARKRTWYERLFGLDTP